MVAVTDEKFQLRGFDWEHFGLLDRWRRVKMVDYERWLQVEVKLASFRTIGISTPVFLVIPDEFVL